MKRTIEKILLKFFPKLYLGLTRAQDSNDRYLFGLNVIKKICKNNFNILDVGCGSGNFYSYINSTFRNIDYTGIDFDYEKISKKKISWKKKL